jgi:hypothetical protein
MFERVDSFGGTDEEYTSYLEKELLGTFKPAVRER